MPDRIRTFIAIDIAAKPFRDVLADLRDMGRPVRAAVEPLHLTLKFLGETDVGANRDVSRAIDTVANETVAFDIEFRGLGAFPKIERPSVIWAGVAPVEPVAAIAEALESKLEPLGFPRESRPFHPHVTLARVKGRPPGELASLVELYSASTFGVVPVRELTFYESRLTAAGPEYSVLSTASLRCDA